MSLLSVNCTMLLHGKKLSNYLKILFWWLISVLVTAYNAKQCSAFQNCTKILHTFITFFVTKL